MPFPPYFTVIGFVIVAVIAYFVYKTMAGKHYGQAADDFLSRHPDAARVYETSGAANALKSQIALDDQISICRVDGILCGGFDGPTNEDIVKAKANPHLAADLFARQSDHVLIVPGQHTISLAAQHSRPGVVYKTVATTYGPVDYVIDLQPGRSYQLSFDRNSQSFAIAERAPVPV